MLHDTGKIVVFDSGFCIIQVLVDIKKKGVYEAALIRKSQYCTCFFWWNINSHFTNKGVGAVNALYGKIDNVTLHAFAMK